MVDVKSLADKIELWTSVVESDHSATNTARSKNHTFYTFQVTNKWVH